MRIITTIASITLALLASCCGPNDAECTQQQNAVVAGMIANGGLVYRPPPAPVFVSCTHAGCLAY